MNISFSWNCPNISTVPPTFHSIRNSSFPVKTFHYSTKFTILFSNFPLHTLLFPIIPDSPRRDIDANALLMSLPFYCNHFASTYSSENNCFVNLQTPPNRKLLVKMHNYFMRCQKNKTSLVFFLKFTYYVFRGKVIDASMRGVLPLLNFCYYVFSVSWNRLKLGTDKPTVNYNFHIEKYCWTLILFQ